MNYWLISDTHLCDTFCHGVEDGIKYCRSLSKTVREGDVLIHLGDVSFGQDEKWHSLIANVPAKTWLILGNHDRRSPMWYLDRGWDFVGNEISIERYGAKILFTHIPTPIERHSLNIHGHLHKPDTHRAAEKIEDGKHFLIESGIRPITLENALKEAVKARA